jgi:hypothetical protein
MYKIFNLIPILFFLLFIELICNNILIYGEVLKSYNAKLVEKSIINSPITNTDLNKELNNLYLEKKNANKLHFQQSVVKVNTNIFTCILENVNSEKTCSTLHDCDDESCTKIDSQSNLIVYGKEPIYSIVTSNSGTSLKEVKLQPGEYEILLKDNDFISSTYCNEIVIDGPSFHEFTVGIDFSEDNSSILCMNISDSCYGIIKSGETKICEINKVFIKNLA